MNVKYNLSVSIIKEGDKYVVYSSALDLSTCGKNIAEAKKSFTEASQLFFEEIIADGTMKEALSDLRWKHLKKQWTPPVIVSQDTQTICVPV